MMYPTGYGAAEHRRALDALIADIAGHGRRKTQGRPAKPKAAPDARVIGATSATGHCAVELRVNPEVIARA